MSTFLPNPGSNSNGLSQAINSIASGFHQVFGDLRDCNGDDIFSMIISSPLDLNLLISGQRNQNANLDFDFEEVFIIQNESEDLIDSPTLSIFWSVVSSFEPSMKRKLLNFITGSIFEVIILCKVEFLYY